MLRTRPETYVRSGLVIEDGSSRPERNIRTGIRNGVAMSLMAMRMRG
jgi:hypothetical protein